MSVELATAYVSLSVSTRDLAKDVAKGFNGVDKQARDAGNKAGEQFSSGVESRTKRLGAILKAGALATGGLIAAAGVVGVKTAAQMEQSEVSFTTMLGSAKKAKAFLGDLAAFAAKTPFELPELQTAAQSLVSIGIKADKVIPIMTSLGNITSGMGTGAEGVKRATIALQQMNAAGRITAEDLNQLRDAGVPVYDLLAKATGKSVKEVANLAQKGKLGQKELSALMTTLESGKGLERFNGLMEKQSQTLGGLWSTLKDTFTQGMANAIQPLVPLLKQGLGAAISLLAANVPKLQTAIANMVAYAPRAAAMFGKIKDGAQGLFDLSSRATSPASSAPHSGGLRTLPLSTASLTSATASSRRSLPSRCRQDAAVSSTFKNLSDGASSLVKTLPAIGPTVEIAAKAFKFMSEHVDLVAKALPFLIAALLPQGRTGR